jgi:hypothetical protein
MPASLMPNPPVIGRRAPRILDALRADVAFGDLRRRALAYAGRAVTFGGFPLVARWNLATDGPALFEEGLRALALDTAVFDWTGCEDSAELPVPPPVDEMVHAIIAHGRLVTEIFDRLDLTCVHQPGHEEFAWHWGDYTHRCYTEAGWGTPPDRYWLDAGETRRRRALLNARYRSIGIGRDGRSHTLDFIDAELLAA